MRLRARSGLSDVGRSAAEGEAREKDRDHVVHDGHDTRRGATGTLTPGLLRSESMQADLPIRCACGAVAGVLRAVSSRRGNRLVCYCDDCQSFAHFPRRVRSRARCARRYGDLPDFSRAPAAHRGIESPGLHEALGERTAAMVCGLLSDADREHVRDAPRAVRRPDPQLSPLRCGAPRGGARSGARAHLHALRERRPRERASSVEPRGRSCA